MKGITSLPTQEEERSDSDSAYSDETILTHYVVRVTPCGKFNFQDFHKYVEEHYPICKYVIGREKPDTDKEHFHMVASCGTEYDIDAVRMMIKSYIDPFWYTDTGSLPRGYGNKQYNLQICEDLDAAISYACKCKEYVYGGWDDEYIQDRASVSFDKKKPIDFKQEYLLLCENFHNNPEMTLEDFMVNFMTLKAKYGQMVRASDAYSYGLSNLIKREPEMAYYTANKFLENNKW